MGGYISLYIIYTPNLGLGIAVPGREREQGRFTVVEGAPREQRGRAAGEHHGAVEGHSRREPEMSFLHLGLSCPRYFPAA